MNTKTKKRISQSLKSYHQHRRSLADVKRVLWFALAIAAIVGSVKVWSPTPTADAIRDDWGRLPMAEDKEVLSVSDIITIEALKADVDIERALDIAWCESSHRPGAKSKISSAAGLFGFIDKTWANYCYGDRLNPVDNARCFMKLYPKHPSWWECDSLI